LRRSLTLIRTLYACKQKPRVKKEVPEHITEQKPKKEEEEPIRSLRDMIEELREEEA